MKNLIIIALVVIALVSTIAITAYATEHSNKPKTNLENKVDSVLSYLKENAEVVDTFDIYLKNIREIPYLS